MNFEVLLVTAECKPQAEERYPTCLSLLLAIATTLSNNRALE